MLALGEMCFEGMGAIEKGVWGVGTGLKCVLRAWGLLKRGFEVLARVEMCFEGMGAIEKGVWGVGTGLKCVLRAWGLLKRGFEV